jgi:hypothetical protein
MNEQKELYLLRIRSQSAYPWIRRLANLVALGLYTLAFMLSALSIVVGALTAKGTLFLPIVLSTLVVSIFLIVAGRVYKEASILLADIADSVTDLNCRYEQ